MSTSQEATTSFVPQPNENGDSLIDRNFIPGGAVIIRHVNNSSAQRQRRGRGERGRGEGANVGSVEDFRYPRENFPAPHLRAEWEASFGGNPNTPMHGEASSSTGNEFIPHRLVVNPGEDVAHKITEFAHSVPRAICVLSASGVVSSVTLHLYSCTATYRGRFDIISLSGSLVPTPDGHGRTGGLAVILGERQERSFGGRVSGFLIADTHVQVIVGSFKDQDC